MPEVPDFKAWLPEPDGFPRPDWKTIWEWIRSHSSEDRWDAAWQEIARVWLDKTAKLLGGAYAMAESENFHLLSELDERRGNELLTFLEQTRARILRTLADIPLPKRYGKHAVLRFSSEDQYYRYIAYFDSEGDYAGEGGFFPRGYMHIAYLRKDIPGRDRRILVHELTHNMLRPVPLPLWLDEALAILFENDIAGDRKEALVTPELANEHRNYWNSNTIQEFWRGDSFLKADASKLAYGMARILLDFIVTDIRPAPVEFRDFVLHADRKDAGEAAARDCLGVELSDLVSAFLGPGEWAPRVATANLS